MKKSEISGTISKYDMRLLSGIFCFLDHYGIKSVSWKRKTKESKPYLTIYLVSVEILIYRPCEDRISKDELAHFEKYIYLFVVLLMFSSCSDKKIQRVIEHKDELMKLSRYQVISCNDGRNYYELITYT